MRKLEFYLKGSKSKKEGKELKGRKRKRKNKSIYYNDTIST